MVAGTVRGKKVTEALSVLKFMPKKGAKILYKVVQSASSNAKNNFNQSTDDLYVTKVLVTKGPTYKRSVPISRGRAHPIRKRTSHITVEVGVKDGTVPVKKAEPSKAPKAEVAKKKPESKVTKAPKKPAPKKTTKAAKASSEK